MNTEISPCLAAEKTLYHFPLYDVVSREVLLRDGVGFFWELCRGQRQVVSVTYSVGGDESDKCCEE